MAEDPDEVYTTTLDDVRKTAKEFGRIVIDLVIEEQVIVLDAHMIGDGYIKQFPYNPLGFVQARRWSVRLDDADIESPQSTEDLIEERRAFLRKPY